MDYVYEFRYMLDLESLPSHQVNMIYDFPNFQMNYSGDLKMMI